MTANNPVQSDEKSLSERSELSICTSNLPFLAIVRASTGTMAFLCNGIILNERWVTALANCIVGRLLTNTMITVGHHDAEQPIPSTNIFISAIVTHPTYNPLTLSNNIGLIQTRDTIAFNDRVQSVPIPVVDVPGGISTNVVGWLATRYINFHTISMVNMACEVEAPTVGSPMHQEEICTIRTSHHLPPAFTFGGILMEANRPVGLHARRISNFINVHVRLATFRDWLYQVIENW
ncbi:anionic trypsin-2-like [Lutzomyia longipalpis]|uniref:anionic trypsin-2-like n=1 Tax=Lutzomyia longipalpis TaxID=7200 RepID=UPI002483E061|nr:anionic trypsin-2-like [Lutzomyia longipalpis]